MPPSHIRTKSQTAIIEDASALPFVLSSHPLSQAQNSSALDDGDEEMSPTPKKKHWFNLRKGRRSLEAEATLEVPPAEPEPNSGRSFVVVRKQRPGAGASPNSAGPSSAPAQERSFAVIRGNSHSRSICFVFCPFVTIHAYYYFSFNFIWTESR